MKKEGSATQNPSGSIPTRTDFVENEKKRGKGGLEAGSLLRGLVNLGIVRRVKAN